MVPGENFIQIHASAGIRKIECSVEEGPVSRKGNTVVGAFATTSAILESRIGECESNV